MNLSKIQQAITELSPQDFARFREWFEEYEARMWDKQIERDAKSGKLDKIVEEAMKDYRAGKAREL